MNCNKCGTENKEGATFCKKCGNSLIPDHICKKCGTENDVDATFCKKCGNSLIPDHICKKCGTENDVDAAFCEKCGEKMKSAKQDIGEAVAKAGKAVKEKSVELGAIVADKTEAVTKQLAENKPAFTAQAQKLTAQANEAVATVQRKTGLNKYIIMGVAALLVVAIVVVAILPLFSAAKSVEIEGSYQYGMIPIKQGDKYGFMDTKGNIAVPCIYDEVMPFENGKAQGKIDGGWQEITSEFAREYEPQIYREDELYLFADFFSEGLAFVAKKDGNGDNKYGYMDKTGKEVIPLIYDEVSPFFLDGLAAVKKDYKWGFIDRTGKEVIPLIYDDAYFFSEGLAFVAKKDGNGDWKYGYTDKTGKEVIPLIYDYVSPFFLDGLAAVEKDYKYGYIDKTGKEVIPLIYDGAYYFSDGLAFVAKKDGNGDWKYGYIDKTGKEVIPLIYDGSYFFSEGLAFVAKEDGNGARKYGFIDKAGKEVIPLIYDGANDFSEGLASVTKKDSNGDKKWGFVDKTGKEVIPLIYDKVNYFSEGLASVTKKDSSGAHKYGFIDKTGKEVIPLIYDDATKREVIPSIYNGFNLILERNFPHGTESFGYILNPIKSYTNPSAISLGEGIFGVKSNAGYSHLENGIGEALVTFDKSLSKCAKLFAEGAKQLDNGNAEKAKSTLLNALEFQPENVHIMSALEKACTQTGDLEKAADYRSQINALSGVKSIDEKRAAATGDSDKLELGKELYSILRNLQ